MARRLTGLLALPAVAVLASFTTAASAAEPPAIYVAGPQGDDPAPLVRFGEFSGQGSPDWSADGSKVAFDAWRPGRGEASRDAHVIALTGAEPRDLGPGAMPSWSPDGTRLAFSSYDPRGVWVMNADGSDRRAIDDAGWCGRWSPDGETIAYTVHRDGRADFCLHDVDTAAKRYLFGDGENPYQLIYWSFCWSPDSRKLCFLGIDGGDDRVVATVSADGPADHHRVHRRGPASAAFAWHPDGGRILMAATDPPHQGNRLYSFAADGSAGPEPLPGLPGGFAATAGDWSPDGSRILFTGFRTDAAE